jgi:UDP-N-acetylmuramoylalanine--D-glutamate ligase
VAHSSRSKKEIKPSAVIPAIDASINWRECHVLVVGLGESGLAAAKWLDRRGARVTVVDTRSDPPMMPAFEERFAGHQGVRLMAGVQTPLLMNLLDDVSMIVPGPGLSPRPAHQGILPDLLKAAAQRGISVVGELDLFEWAIHHGGHASSRREEGNDLELPLEAPKIIAITGTNGKTTTTQMVTALLRRAGFDAQEAGNISPSLLDAVMAREDGGYFPQVWVLELSSFQLAIAQHFHPTAAALLNISPDHLDWHDSMEDYLESKCRVFGFGAAAPIDGVRCITDRAEQAVMDVLQSKAHLNSQVVTFGRDAPQACGDFGLIEEGISWMCLRDAHDADRLHRLMPADALRMRGRHNAMNALSALALCQAVTPALAPLLHGLRMFEGGAHRMQWVGQAQEIQFINDSKGTNVGATAAALSGCGMKVVLIAGGDGKGQDFTALQDPIAAHARAVVTIGRDGPRLAEVARAAGVPVESAQTMEEAVRHAFALADAGQAVLLSPACASFDMFKNYADRADAFVRAVQLVCEEQGVTC